ncbi:hypothetical protein LZ31DRAFT_188954 [Colletotrichum somersetense]|nr:hypothetical protein LZ31DRAFT_188954 [Colletotrichum somersetense]
MKIERDLERVDFNRIHVSIRGSLRVVAIDTKPGLAHTPVSPTTMARCFVPTVPILTSRSKVAACQPAAAEGPLGVVADMLGFVRLEAAGAQTPGERRDDSGGLGQGVVHDVGVHLVGLWLRGFLMSLKIGWRPQQDSPSFILAKLDPCHPPFSQTASRHSRLGPSRYQTRL